MRLTNKKYQLPLWLVSAESWRERLADAEAVPQLTLLGLLVGVGVGVLVIAFHGLMNLGQTLILPDGVVGHFELLSWPMRLAFPIIGVLFVALERPQS